MKAAIASDHGKPIFDAGEEWRGAILFAYFTGARLQDVANVALECNRLARKDNHLSC